MFKSSITCSLLNVIVVCFRPSKRIEKFQFKIYRCDAEQLIINSAGEGGGMLYRNRFPSRLMGVIVRRIGREEIYLANCKSTRLILSTLLHLMYVHYLDTLIILKIWTYTVST